MKTIRGPKWVVLSLLLLTIGVTTVAEAGFGTYYRHYIYGSRGTWTFRYRSRNYAYWYIDVPSNAKKLQIDLGFDRHRGYGDCDLYVGYGFVPYRSGRTYTYRRTSSNYRENLTIMNPRAGRWYIRLRGYSNYRTCMRIICQRKTTTYNWRTDMLNRVNSYRRQYGRGNLYQQSQLQTAAQNYAYDMAIKHYYGGRDHIGSTYANYTMVRRITAAGYRYSYAAENIAYGYTSVARVMSGWWNSSGHRNNILGSYYTQVGFGYYYSSDSYGRRWVQDFGRPQ